MVIKRILICFKWTHRRLGQAYGDAKLYLTEPGIILSCLKSIGQFDITKLTIRAFIFEHTVGLKL